MGTVEVQLHASLRYATEMSSQLCSHHTNWATRLRINFLLPSCEFTCLVLVDWIVLTKFDEDALNCGSWTLFNKFAVGNHKRLVIWSDTVAVQTTWRLRTGKALRHFPVRRWFRIEKSRCEWNVLSPPPGALETVSSHPPCGQYCFF